MPREVEEMGIPDLYKRGKVVVVTGACRGLGKSMALTFAEAGADVAISDVVVDDGLLKTVSRQIQSFGRRVLTAEVDVTSKR